MRNRKRTTLPLVVLLASALAGSALAEEPAPGYLGVYLTNLSKATRAALGLERNEGVLIERVVSGEAAEESGLRSGDVLLRMDGQPVNSSESLGEALELAGAGKKVPIEILRDGERQTLQATLGDRTERRRTAWAPFADDGLLFAAPETPALPELSAELAPLAAPRAFALLRNPTRTLGIRTMELNGQLAAYFEVGGGLLVTWVVPDSPAGRAGMKAGDILTTLDGQPVVRDEDLSFILGGRQDEGEMDAEVVRHGGKQSLHLAF
ncbi:MAG: PDZ domain-containing protein [Acidobacteriota bacterium]|jgi:serine protease Do